MEAGEKLRITNEKISLNGTKQPESELEVDSQTNFTSNFSKIQIEIEDELNCVEDISEEKRADFFNEINIKIEAIEQFYTKSISFLPQYFRRSTQEKIKALLSLAEKQKSIYLPKKKFGFSKKTSKDISKPKKSVVPLKEIAQPAKLNIEELCSQNSLKISDLNDTRVTKDSSEVSGRDVIISQACNSRIELHGHPGFVSIRNLTSCQVFIGPVRGSVLIEDCQKCVFVTACQQMRIHRTTDTSFHIHVTSKAIIEECSRVGFAPFNWSYPGIEVDYQETELDRSRNNWNDVDDFDWLVDGQHSPNWFAIPEDERSIKENG